MPHKRERPGRGEALIYPGKADQNLDTPNRTKLQGDDETYRALHLVQRFAVRPEMALAMAGLAFGGGQ